MGSHSAELLDGASPGQVLLPHLSSVLLIPSFRIALNKALKQGSGFAGFYYRINVHFNPFQQLTPRSSCFQCLRRAVTLPKCLICPIRHKDIYENYAVCVAGVALQS